MYFLQKSTVLAGVLTASLLLSAQPARDDSPSMSLNVRNVSLGNVLRIISEKTGYIFIPDPTLGDLSITASLDQVQPREALEIIARLYGLGFQKLGETDKYIVTSAHNIRPELVLDQYRCEFARAADIKLIIEKMITPDFGSVMMDERTNTLIILESAPRLRQIKAILEILDRPTRQIYIKGVIAEVSLSKSSDTGVQWFGENRRFQAATDFDLKPLPGTLPETPSLPIGNGFKVGILDMNIDLALRLLSTRNDLNLLSTPYLVTLDNQYATIEVGDQIPYKKLNEYGVTSYEFKNATIKLSIRPHINNDTTLTVQLEPQANFQKGFTADGVPIISTRNAHTQVLVGSGQTVVIGGIMQESDVRTESRVPLLGALPVVGHLFKSQKISRQKTELIVMLTPEIVDFNQRLAVPAAVESLLQNR